jgi:hypothetical protein
VAGSLALLGLRERGRIIRPRGLKQHQRLKLFEQRLDL